MKTIQQIINESTINKRDTRHIIMHVLNINNTTLLTAGDTIVNERDLNKISNVISKVKAGMPLAYALGTASFMGMDFYVNNNVLIPRPETEQLVEEAIAHINKTDATTVLDMCTGSGCIVVSLAHFANVTGIGADISAHALEVAGKNATSHNVANKVTFVQTNMFQNISTKVDLIVSNPPYIPTHEMLDLDSTVADHEPHLALHGGDSGLHFYEIIAQQGGNYLTTNGAIFLEIGYNQGESIKNIFEAVGYKKIEIKKDYAGHDRMAMIYS